MSNEEDVAPYLLDVYMPRVKEFMEILKGVGFRDYCSLKFYSNGLRLTADDEIEVQANAYFKTEFFTEYNVREAEVNLVVKTKILLQTLGMFHEANGVAARLIYRTYGESLEIHMESSTMNAQVSVPTHPELTLLNIQCDSDPMPVKIIFTPPFLRELIRDLDNTCHIVKCEFHADRIRFETKGEIFQATDVGMCDENTDDFVITNALTGGVIVCYRVENLRKILPILSKSKKAALRVDANGVMCIQLMIEHDESTLTFIEFLIYRTVMGEDELLLGDDSSPTQRSNPRSNASRVGGSNHYLGGSNHSDIFSQ